MELRIFVLVSFVGIASTVPHDFCLETFDGGDCGKLPVLVFHYYKSGSRCEIMKWRGCKTKNIFPDEIACSNLCIYNLTAEIDEPPGLDIMESSFKEELEQLTAEVLKEIDNMLDEIIVEPDKEKREELPPNSETDEKNTKIPMSKPIVGKGINQNLTSETDTDEDQNQPTESDKGDDQNVPTESDKGEDQNLPTETGSDADEPAATVPNDQVELQ